MKTILKRILANDKGFSLVEILVSTVVIGVGAIGLGLMFSTGNTWVVAKGDDRVALGLAVQRLEHYRQIFVDFGLNGVPVGKTTEDTGNWDEFVGALDPARPAGARSFVRETCVQSFDPKPIDPDPNVRNNLNADNPYTADCLAGAGPAKRITVIVAPTQAQTQGDPVVVQAWLQ